ncbi:hypothetical protein CEE69_01680 [Rhodopirellula bahusiensis]|uniref:Uncharacterized protein n=2 Tax=Rhodopirellula bahusiensis TaxID=2014065 RepID=A0A2G1WDK2_9BACT|nr:hypothetical protein CEE69_01680 [Rhodopirellula bahusiensis]
MAGQGLVQRESPHGKELPVAMSLTQTQFDSHAMSNGRVVGVTATLDAQDLVFQTRLLLIGCQSELVLGCHHGLLPSGSDRFRSVQA